MRRYGGGGNSTHAPGQDTGLKLTLTPSTTPCAPSPTGLFWFSETTGEYTEETEAAYLLQDGAAGPVAAVAAVIGQTCGTVSWAAQWLPESGTGGNPGLYEDTSRLIVYPLLDTTPGILSVTAECGGASFGPIYLALTRYVCYYYGAQTATYWHPIADVFTAANPVDITFATPVTVPDTSPNECDLSLSGTLVPVYPLMIRITCTSPVQITFYISGIGNGPYYYGGTGAPFEITFGSTNAAPDHLRIDNLGTVAMDITLEVACTA